MYPSPLIVTRTLHSVIVLHFFFKGPYPPVPHGAWIRITKAPQAEVPLDTCMDERHLQSRGGPAQRPLRTLSGALGERCREQHRSLPGSHSAPSTDPGTLALRPGSTRPPGGKLETQHPAGREAPPTSPPLLLCLQR